MRPSYGINWPAVVAAIVIYGLLDWLVFPW